MNGFGSMLKDYLEYYKIAKENNISLCFLYTRLAYDKRILYSSKEYLNNIEKI